MIREKKYYYRRTYEYEQIYLDELQLSILSFVSHIDNRFLPFPGCGPIFSLNSVPIEISELYFSSLEKKKEALVRRLQQKGEDASEW